MLRLLTLALPLARAALLMNYEADSHGTYVGAVCPSHGICQLNAHVIFMVSPELPLSEVAVGAKFELDGSGVWSPMGVDSEHMMWNASNPRVSTGRVATQFKGYLQASLLENLPSTICAKVWAVDLTNGDTATLEATCLDVVVENITTPQVPELAAAVNHAAITYYCAPDGDTDAANDDCLFDAHMIVSTYAVDPTHVVFGGGAFQVDSAPDWDSEGLIVLGQAKPSHTSAGPQLGPRVQVSYERRGPRSEVVPKTEICFTLWVADDATHERIAVLGNDIGEDLPAPKSPGVFCYPPFAIV